MRNFCSLSQCFLFCATLLFSFKSFAVVCPSPSGITSSITCTGNITTLVDDADGIYLLNSSSNNNNNTVNMTGNITTNGNNAVGIDLLNNDRFNNNGTNNTNTVNMTGNITTNGTEAVGIDLSNNDGTNNTNTVNMTGNITTNGDNARGIYLYNFSGASNTNIVNITGNIKTNSGDVIHLVNISNFSSSGVSNNTNNTNILNMIGNITTGNSRGINIQNPGGTNNTNIVNMIGNITTSGTRQGVYLSNIGGGNNNNTVNMTGNITTSGTAAYGIDFAGTYSSDSTNTVNMIGNVTTSGANAFGIRLDSDAVNHTNTVNMVGNITTSANRADGIFVQSNGSNSTNTVNITGNITTSGAQAEGIFLSHHINAVNNNNIVNITGQISATGGDTYAISTINNSPTSTNTVQLNKGSSVIGAIRSRGTFASNDLLKLNLGAGASYSFTTEGFTVQDLNGRPMVTGSAHAAGVGNITTASQSLYERTSQITQSLDDRLRTHDLKQNTNQPFWINTYYSDSSRGGQGLSGANLSFNQYSSGITAGFNVKNSYTPTEFIVNFEHGQLNIDGGNQSIQSNGLMAGALLPDIAKLFTGTLSARALVGYSDFSGDRKVLTNDIAFNGSRNVTANYQSTHLTIGSAWTKTLYQTDKIILDTLLGVDLNTQHINSYSESDLFKWNDRTINQLQERVSLGLEIKPFVRPLTLYGRVGIEHRDLLSGENQNFEINNTAVSYKDSNQRNTYATLNAGAYYPLTPTIKAFAQIRYYDSDKNIESLSGNIGISGQF